jgi:hypothetical protein
MNQAEHVWHSPDRRTLPTCLLCGQGHPNPLGTVLPFGAALKTVPLYHCSERAAIRRKFETLARRRP